MFFKEGFVEEDPTVKALRIVENIRTRLDKIRSEVEDSTKLTMSIEETIQKILALVEKLESPDLKPND